MLPIPQQTAARQAAGVVVSAGKMMGTVKVRIAKQVWNKRVKKYYNDYDTVMVSDPASSTREGDVVTVRRTQRISQHVRHVVAGIVAPMGTPISSRPSVPSEEVLTARREAKRAAKDERQAARGRVSALQRVKERERNARAAVHETRLAQQQAAKAFWDTELPGLLREVRVQAVKKRRHAHADFMKLWAGWSEEQRAEIADRDWVQDMLKRDDKYWEGRTRQAEQLWELSAAELDKVHEQENLEAKMMAWLTNRAIPSTASLEVERRVVASILESWTAESKDANFLTWELPQHVPSAVEQAHVARNMFDSLLARAERHLAEIRAAKDLPAMQDTALSGTPAAPTFREWELEAVGRHLHEKLDELDAKMDRLVRFQRHVEAARETGSEDSYAAWQAVMARARLTAEEREAVTAHQEQRLRRIDTRLRREELMAERKGEKAAHDGKVVRELVKRVKEEEEEGRREEVEEDGKARAERRERLSGWLRH